MDQITNFFKSYFSNVNEFVVNNHPYINGEYLDHRYMVSYSAYYIITKRVDNEERYVGVCQNVEQVLNILSFIRDQEPIVVDDVTKMVANMTGCKTV
jgi:hypothetical protein